MHCWPRSIRDNFDCCQASWSQTTSRLRSHRFRMCRTSPANPLHTTVTSFCGPLLMRPPELIRSIVTKTIRSQRIPHSPDRMLLGPHNSGEVPGDRTEIGEHTSELQSHLNLVCRLLLEKKN